MPVIYMKHPRHGEKVATMDLEAEEDERNGWERFDPAAPAPAEPAPQAVESAPVVNEMRRRGRVRREPEHDDHGG